MPLMGGSYGTSGGGGSAAWGSITGTLSDQADLQAALDAKNISATTIGAVPNANAITLVGQQIQLQPASASFGGVVTTGVQSFAGAKTFTGAITASNLSGTNTGDQTITLTSDVTGSGTGSFAVTIAADAVTNAKLANMATQTFKGRTTAGTGDPEDLSIAQAQALLGTTGTNTGDVTLTTIGAVPNANAASLSGQQLQLQPANGTFGGVLTAGAQSIAGAKTFTGAITASNLSGTNSGDITLGAVGSSANANAATLAAQVLNLEPASASFPGVVTTGVQSFAGAKTFTGAITASNLSGTNTGDQTITLTSDVTGSGTGSFATTIAAGVVTNAKLATVATATFKGRTTAGTGAPEDLTVAQAKVLLNLTGTNSGDVTLAGENYLSIASQVITANAVNLAGTNVTGTLPVTKGGTGTATAFTPGSIVFAGASGVYSQDNTNLFFDDTNNFLGLGTASPAANLHIAGNTSAAAWTVNGIGIRQATGTYTDTTSSGTVTNMYVHNIAAPTVAASSVTTYSQGASWNLFPITAGTNVTITNNYALWVHTGNTRLDGKVGVGAVASITSVLQIGGNLSSAAWTNISPYMHIGTGIITDTTSSGAAGSVRGSALTINGGTIAASSVTTYSNFAAVMINAAPAAGTNVTITNSYSIYAVAGNAYFADNIGINTLGPTAQLHVTCDTSSKIASVIKGAASQSANLTEWQNSSSVVQASVGPSGNFVFNETGADADCRIEGDTDVNLVYTDASTDRVGVGIAAPTQKLGVSGNLALETAGNGLYVKEGSNATMGTATLVAGTAVVSTTKVTASSRIFMTSQTNSGTVGALCVSARVAGTSFTILSTSATHTSAVAWMIVEPA